MEQDNEKEKAFVARILQECEQEGFTIAETLHIPQALKFALNDRVLKIHEETRFCGSKGNS